MDDYNEAFTKRREVLEKFLGPASDGVLASSVPLYLGGDADVMTFPSSGHGVCYVTGGLTGFDAVEQAPNDDGNYELMICTPKDEAWAANLISRLAVYSLEHPMSPGETMDWSRFPGSSKLKALLFAKPPKAEAFSFDGQKFSCLLCVGITAEELRRCRTEGSDAVLEDLKSRGVFPMTDIGRE